MTMVQSELLPITIWFQDKPPRLTQSTLSPERGLPCCTLPSQAVIWTLPELRLVLSSLLALITGQALNSVWQQAPPLIWEVMNLMSTPIDGMASDKLSHSPPGEHCHGHTLHLTLQLLPFILSGICLWNKQKKILRDFAVWTHFDFILLYQPFLSVRGKNKAGVQTNNPGAVLVHLV